MEKIYKRKDRSVSPEVRQKISQSLTGKPKSETHKAHISQSLRADTGGYWSHIPAAPEKNNQGQVRQQGGTTMDDILL